MNRIKTVILLLALSACCSVGENTATDFDPEVPLRERLNGVAVGAHRGGLFLDANTIHRFEKARRAGADIVEMDVRETRDGIPVVYHDPRINQLFGGGPAINSLTREELRRHRVAFQYPIPTFEEVLQWDSGRIIINAEFKTREVIAAAVRLVQEYDAYNWVYFQTKSDRERYGTARALDARVALLFKPESLEDLDWALALDDENLVVIEIDPGMRRPEVIQRVREAGKLSSYNSWRLDLFQEFFQAVATRVYEEEMDIAITNRPCSAVSQRDVWNARPQAQ